MREGDRAAVRVAVGRDRELLMLRPSFAVFALTYYLLAGLGVNLGYHRVLSHRSLKLSKWLEYRVENCLIC